MSPPRSAEEYIGRNLRRLRLQKRLPQRAIADALGLHPPAVSLLEAGGRRLTLFEAGLLERKFGIPVRDLLNNVTTLF